MRLLESLLPTANIRQPQNPFRTKNEDEPTQHTEETGITKEASSVQYLPDDYSFKTIPSDTYNAVRPFLAFLRAQESKRYYDYEFDPSGDIFWHISLKNKPGEEALVQRLVLVGTYISLGGDDFGTLHISLVNEMGNADTEQSSEEGLSLDNGELLLACSSPESGQCLKKLRLLSIFEYMSIFKALTGTVISTIGVIMPDIHLVLSSAFNFKDWCEVYFEDQGWVKLWCHINRVTTSSQGKTSSQRQIRFYKDEKSMSSRNLVCFIPETEYIQDVFFYRERDEKSVPYYQLGQKGLLDDLTTIKVLGNVCYPKENSHRNLLRSPSSVFLKNSNTSSKTSLTTTVNNRRKSIFGAFKGHQRRNSNDSAETVCSSITDMSKVIKDSGGLLIRPLAHEGLGHLEAMVRFILPIMDCSHKYGRPGNFKKDRTDPECLMFGLPKLPSVDYFAYEEMADVLAKEPLTDGINSKENTVLAMSQFTALLNDCISKNSERESQYNFQKLGSISGGDVVGSQFPRDGGYLSVSSNSLSII